MRLNIIYGVAFLWVYCIFPLSTPAQLPHEYEEDSEEELFFRHLTQKDGLPSHIARTAISDPWGYTWIGTDNGLVRYDGKNMDLYQYIPGSANCPVSSSIHSLFISRDSNLWIGTRNGFSIYNSSLDEFSNFRMDLDNPKSFPAEWVWDFYEDMNGKMFIGTYNGLVSFDPHTEEFQHIKTGNTGHWLDRKRRCTMVTGIHADPRDSSCLLLATRGGLLQVDKNNGKILKDYNSNGLQYDLDQLAYMKHGDVFFPCGANYLDGDSLLWCAEWGTDLKVFNLKDESWRVHADNTQDNQALNILRIIPKSEEELWIATAWKGLGVFNKKDLTFRFYKHDERNTHSLLGNSIKGDLFLDEEQSIWILHASNGISILDKSYRSFRNYSVPVISSKSTDFLKDSRHSKFYISAQHSGGLAEWDMKQRSWKVVPFRRNNTSIDLSTQMMIQDRKDVIWLATDDGLYTYNIGSDYINKYLLNEAGIPTGGTNRQIMELFEDSKGLLWIGTKTEGLFSLNPDRDILSTYDLNKGLQSSEKSREIRSIKEDKYGRIWIGSYNELNIYDYGCSCFVKEFNQVLSSIEITNPTVLGMALDSLNNLYISIQNKGILKIVEPIKGKFEVRLYHLSHGINDLNLGFMKSDQHGNIWVINEGLLRFNPYTESFLFIDSRNGLQSDKSVEGGDRIFLDEDDYLILTGQGGYETIHTNALQNTGQISNVLPESMDVNGKKHLSGLSLLEPKRIRLPPGSKNVTFTYTSICNKDPDLVKYRYRLEGNDTDWILAGPVREARYTNLSPGEYTFHFNASHRGILSDIERKIEFSIAPYLWQTLAFKIFFISCLLLLIYTFYKTRTNRFRKEAGIKAAFQKRVSDLEMEALRSQMNPHFLFNSINSIKSFIAKSEARKATEHLNKFALLMRLVLNHSKESLIPLSQELRVVRLYVELEQMRFSDKFDLSINIAESINPNETYIQPLLLQPLVENSIRHGFINSEKRGHITINIHGQGVQLYCEIEDDGIGFKAAQPKSHKKSSHKSLGLEMTKERILHFGGTDSRIEITDLGANNSLVSGTRIRLVLPLIIKKKEDETD